MDSGVYLLCIVALLPAFRACTGSQTSYGRHAWYSFFTRYRPLYAGLVERYRVSFVEWLGKMGVVPLADVLRACRTRWPQFATSEGTAALEALFSLWPEVQVKRSSIFDVTIAIAGPADLVNARDAEDEMDAATTEDIAHRTTTKKVVRERKASYKKRTTTETQQGDLSGQLPVYAIILLLYICDRKKQMEAKELLGVTLGTWTLESVIGRGGMGAVYLAQQSRPVRTVAVKVLISAMVQDPDQQHMFLARFQREADTIARLEHKNILPIYEYDEAVVKGQKLAYLVMPFIRGGTLRERIEEMRRSGSYFDFRQVKSYLSQMADALDYAHSMGVVHRDIKPANLLFHSDGRLLLSDFGIVRLQAMPGLTIAGSFVGTAEYASPEQISSGDVDFRSDIYSLGIILYELLTGTVPFTASNPFAVMHMKLNEPVPSVRSRRPDLSPAIDAVVMKALSRNPADRYQSATAFADDFRAALNVNGNQGVLRFSGDANNDDRTVSSAKWGGGEPAMMSATVPVLHPLSALPRRLYRSLLA